MEKSGAIKPVISQGWLRALLFLIAFGIATGIFLVVYLVALHKGSPDAAGLENLLKGNNLLVTTAIIFALSLILTFVFRRWVDRKSFVSLGLDFNGHGGEAIAGGMLAIFIICACSLLLKATGHLRWMDIIFDSRALFLAFGSVVIISFYEELIFRGYILNNLMDSFPGWLALMISAILFMIFHWTGQSSIGFFPLANLFILGLILGLNYIYTRNLWFSFFFHAAWKFMEGPAFGYSGDDSFQTFLQPELNGDINITGGANGLEGSMILTAVALLSLIALYLFLQRKFNPRFRPAPGRI
ncbi:MAG TPA: CPBP family intramembrane glutamic endopeptidase [Puia sp.]|nr:CPBP family intramembrane glutamic endopeptidase [Puia sp.]